MFDLSKFFTRGLRNTILAKPGIHFSFKGPWTQIYTGQAIDRWHVGDFTSAEYTIAIDLDQNNREIIKCLVVASPNDASVTVYGRSATAENLVDVTAQVTGSYAELVLSAKPGKSGAKASFSATYYETHNPI